MRAIGSVEARDGFQVEHAGVLDAFAAALCQAGLEVADPCLATAEDVLASGSSWAKRLGIPARRSAWLVVARRPEEAVHTHAPDRVEAHTLRPQERAAQLDAGARTAQST